MDKGQEKRRRMRRQTRKKQGRKKGRKHRKEGQGEGKESAGPGQFRARLARGINGGSGRRGTPRRRITEALATACPTRAEI